jgi:GT2 family glycosyltransferase
MTSLPTTSQSARPTCAAPTAVIAEAKHVGAGGDLITICIPTYRRPTALLHCLHSCLAQDYRPLEIDISDNSHTDETQVLVESVAVPDGVTVRYWRNFPSTGMVENYQKLLAAVRGRRFLWMNDDDVLLHGAVTAMADAFSAAPDVILSFGREQIINPEGELLPEQTDSVNLKHSRFAEYTGLRRDLLLCAFLGHVPHVGFLVLTEPARKVGIRDRSEIGLAVDADFAVRLGQAYKGFAHVFLDCDTLLSRLGSSTLSVSSLDVAYQFYHFIRQMDDLTPQESVARDRLVRILEPRALREISLVNGRLAALRTFRARSYRSVGGLFRWCFCLALIVTPNLTDAMYRMIKSRFGKSLRRRPSIRPRKKRPPLLAASPHLTVPDRL